MKPPLARWRGLLYLSLLGGGAALVIAWWPELSEIWRAHAWTFLVAAGLMCLGQVVQARNFVAFLDTPVTLDRWRLSGVWAMSALANYAGPFQPGIAVRVLHLQRRGVAVRDSLLATWRQLSASVWVSLLGLGVGFAMLESPQARTYAAVLLVAFVALYLLRATIARMLAGLSRPAWLVANRSLLARAVGQSSARGVSGVMLQYLIGWLLVWWVYSRFGAPIDPGFALVIACFVYVSSLVAVVPGNFGLLEGIYIVGAHDFGLSVQEGAALAFLIRAAHVASCVIVALLAGRREPIDQG